MGRDLAPSALACLLWRASAQLRVALQNAPHEHAQFCALPRGARAPAIGHHGHAQSARAER